MSERRRAVRYRVALAVLFLVAYEAFMVVRWLFFSGPEPSLHDLGDGLLFFFLIWGGIVIADKVGGWLKQQEASENEIITGLRDIRLRLREIETRVETLCNWGNLSSLYEAEDEGYQLEEELDETTVSEIAEYKKQIDIGEEDYHYHLGVTYWNLAMQQQRMDEPRKAAHWLVKAAHEGHDCENTLADVYMKLQEYEKAMFWHRRSVKRGGSFVSSSESEIADMYAEGRGVLQNQAEAARWRYRSAMHGSYWSHYLLGKMFAEGGDGVEKDRDKAFFHLYIASFATGLHSPKDYAAELRHKVENDLDEWVVAKQTAMADQWLASDKEARKAKLKPFPLPD